MLISVFISTFICGIFIFISTFFDLKKSKNVEFFKPGNFSVKNQGNCSRNMQNMKRNQKIAKFSACGGPKRIKERENIDFKLVLKKIHILRKVKKHWSWRFTILDYTCSRRLVMYGFQARRFWPSVFRFILIVFIKTNQIRSVCIVFNHFRSQLCPKTLTAQSSIWMRMLLKSQIGILHWVGGSG